MSGSWEHFEHGADIGIRGFGATAEAAFEQAALALFAIITELDTIIPSQAVAVRCEAPDHELLLAEWLNCLIYEMAVRRMLFSRFEAHLADARLDGVAWGEAIALERHRPVVEIKGATYTALCVACEGGVWLAQAVVDV